MGKEREASLFWDEQGLPYSNVFDDKYFCKESGYEEALYVSCHGNNLRERFTSLDKNVSGVFTIIETGFGTGLDFCCAWQLWCECAPCSWQLHFISIELYPLSIEQIKRALSVWPCLSPHREQLIDKYCVEDEVGDFVLDEGRTRLTIVFKHVDEALNLIKSRGITTHGWADVWFMDGFAPSKNPEMWSENVFKGMAALSRTGTTLSTFTVAGFVRRGLEASGFAVKKIEGHGLKKNFLSGSFR